MKKTKEFININLGQKIGVHLSGANKLQAFKYMKLENIKKFMSITSELATAGQPSEDQLNEVFHAGFEVVINLGLLDPKYCLKDEATLVKSLGLQYHHIPVSFQEPNLDDLQNFFDILNRLKNKKVFVHCAANKRVSCFIALYGEAKLGWSRKKADDIIKTIWHPDEVWKLFIGHVRTKIINE